MIAFVLPGTRLTIITAFLAFEINKFLSSGVITR